MARNMVLGIYIAGSTGTGLRFVSNLVQASLFSTSFQFLAYLHCTILQQSIQLMNFSDTFRAFP